MVERHVVFQTIKIGDMIWDYLAYSKEASDPLTLQTTIYQGYTMAIADVLPFHIVGGHITTHLPNDEWEILLAGMDKNGKVSVPIAVDFRDAHALAYDIFWASNYVDLEPIVNSGGPDRVRDRTVSLKTKKNRFTHIYLRAKYRPDRHESIAKIMKNDFITMTLIIEKED